MNAAYCRQFLCKWSWKSTFQVVGKSIVGIVKVSAAAHPDATDTEGKWFCVDVQAVMPLVTPVSLAGIKAEPRLDNMALVKLSRLSVQPVTADEWKLVCAMGGIASPDE